MVENCSNMSYPGCSLGMDIGYSYVITIVAIIGIVSNILNIIVFSKKTFTGSSFTYMRYMAVMDLVTCSLYLPMGIWKCRQLGQEESFKRAIFHWH